MHYVNIYTKTAVTNVRYFLRSFVQPEILGLIHIAPCTKIFSQLSDNSVFCIYDCLWQGRKSGRLDCLVSALVPLIITIENPYQIDFGNLKGNIYQKIFPDVLTPLNPLRRLHYVSISIPKTLSKMRKKYGTSFKNLFWVAAINCIHIFFT